MRKIIDTELLTLIDQGMLQKEIAQRFQCSPAAISKRLRKLRQRIPKAFDKLNVKKQNFAIALATGESKTKAAALFYNTSTVDSARTIGKRLGGDSDIQTAVAEILQRNGLTKQYRVNRLRELVDSLDSNVALKAIDMTFKLDGSYSPETHNVNVRTHEALVENRQSLEQASREAKSRRAAALKQIAILEAQDKSRGEKP
jgi:hypothetical protein